MEIHRITRQIEKTYRSILVGKTFIRNMDEVEKFISKEECLNQIEKNEKELDVLLVELMKLINEIKEN